MYFYMSLSGDIFEESIQASLSEKNEIMAALREIINGQKTLNARIVKLEANQTALLRNQIVLSQGQANIVSNQEQIANRVQNMAQSTAQNTEMMALTKAMRECKVTVKKIENSVCRMTGEIQDKDMDEVASMLPLETPTAVREIEEKLQLPEFAQSMTAYLYKMKGTSEDVSTVTCKVFTDDLEKYNWDGRWEKKSLAELTLVNTILRDVFKNQGAFNYQKNVRKAVELSHHHVQQKKYLNKGKSK